jgi:hypothetical protein
VPFREPLDLGDIMPAFEKVLGKAPSAERHAADEKAVDRPLHMGGDPVCSSSKVLDTTGTQVCWDVNGYYRELGVHWRASKAEMKRAYWEADGPNDARLTYVFKQLLNKETRAEYDAMPLGSVFLDEYIGEWLKQRAIREAARRTGVGGYVSPEDILAEWGFDLHTSETADLIGSGASETDPPEDLDLQALREQDDASQVEYQGRWPYGFYLWHSLCVETDRLGLWQTLLVDALAEQGAVVRFAVGYFGRGPSPYTIGLVGGGVYVVYLNDSVTPDPEVAGRAAQALLREMKQSRPSEQQPSSGANVTTTAKPKFGKGGAAAEEAEEIARRAGGKHFHRVPFFNIKDGETETLRYLTDSPDWIFVKQHAFVPTKNKPEDYKGTKWPESMPATCRHDDAFEGMYDDCYICDSGITNMYNKPCNPQVRVWALAVRRDEVRGTQEMADAGQIQPEQVGTILGYRDAMREVEETDAEGNTTGKTRQEMDIVLVNMAVSNYFGGLQAAYGTFGTVCDRDYKVNRKGEGKDSEYHHINLDKTPSLMPGSEKWARYEKAIEDQKIDLGEIIADRATDDYYARFFDPNKTPAKRESSSDKDVAPAAQQEAAPSNDVDPDRLAAMRERVRGTGTAAQSPVAAATAVDYD